MDLDLKICVPQLSFEKNVRIRTPIMTLTHLATQIKERFVTLPSKVSFHLDKDPQSIALDSTKLLTHYGFGGFSQENKTLYIYYSESAAASEPFEKSETRSSTTKSVTSSENPEKKKVIVNIEKKIIHKEILVTILNPFLITNNTFVANSSIKLDELLSLYKKRLDWGLCNDRLGLSLMNSANIFSADLRLYDVTKEDEIILYVRERGFQPQKPQKPIEISQASELDSDIEFVEKKNKTIYIPNAQTMPSNSNKMQEEVPQQQIRKVKIHNKPKSSTSVNKENDVEERKGSAPKANPVSILKSLNNDLDSLMKLQKQNSSGGLRTNSVSRVGGGNHSTSDRQNHFVIDEEFTQ